MMQKIRYDEKIQYEFTGEVLKVSGTLLRPGTFTVLDGSTIDFTSEAIKDIMENIQGNVPLKLTHLDEKIVGYATKFVLDEDDKIKFSGYVFDSDAITKIIRDGYDSVSGEFMLELDDGRAVGGVLTAIAFVTLPAVPDANIEEARIVALSRKMEGVKKMEEVAKPKKEEFIAYIIEQVKAKGVTDESVLQIFKDVLNEAIKEPYPYPYPAPEPQVLERIKELETELAKYKQFYNSAKESEFEKLVTELKTMGIKDPASIVSDIEDIECKINLLKKLKENIVLSMSTTTTSIPVNVVEDKYATLARILNISVDDARKLFGGERK